VIRRPEIYISAASPDLGIAVNLVRAEILQMDATPVHVDNYPAQWASAWSLMEHHISKCDAMLHLAGSCFGPEPANRPTAEPRRSYAQLEYAMARSLGKNVFAVVCDAEFPFLSHPPEQEEAAALQHSHQERLVRHNGAEIRVQDMEALRTSIRRLKSWIDETRQQLAQHPSPPPAQASPQAPPLPVLTAGTELFVKPSTPRNMPPWHAPQPAPNFVGRTLEKESIQQALKSSFRVCVTGSRGIGKSSLIAASLAQIAPGPDAPGAYPGGIFRYNFHEAQGHYSALAGILTQAGLRDVPDTKHEAAVKQLLSKRDVCLILEGAEVAENLGRLLQLAGPAHLVVEALEPFALPGVPTVTVHPLSLEDGAFCLYRSRLGKEPHLAVSAAVAQPELAGVGASANAVAQGATSPPSPTHSLPQFNDPVWQEIAGRMGSHPLILELTAQHLASEQIVPSSYLARLRRDGIDFLETIASEQKNVPWILAQCAQSFSGLDAAALPAWYALSLHAPTPAPTLSIATALGVRPSEVEVPLQHLMRRGFLTEHDVSGAEPGTREKAWTLTSVGLAEAARLQWEWRDPIQQHSIFDPRSVYQRWRDWVLTYLRQCWKTRSVVGGTERYQVLEPHLHALLRAIERNEGISSPNLLAALRWLSALHRLLGRFASAQPLSERLLSLSQSLYGPEHPETLSSMNNLATLHYRKGDLGAAEPLYRHTLQLREKILGPDHPDTLSSKNNMANVLADRHDVNGAETLYRASFEGRVRILGPEHQDTLVSAKSLANLLLDKGEFTLAEPLYRSTLEAQLRVLGPLHPDTAMTSYNYARLCVQLRRPQEAVTLAQHAVDTARQIFPEGHPHRQRYEQLLSRLMPETAGKN
jgi:hypothetical protein